MRWLRRGDFGLDDSPLSDDQSAVWRYAPEGWRLARRLSPRTVDLYLRVRSGLGLPGSFRARFAAMQLPEETVNRVLAEVRGLGDWMPAWNRAAQRHISEARREDAANRWQEAAVARRRAAMCFHAAHLITDMDIRTVRALRATSVTVFGQALPLLTARARRVQVAWRTHQLPAYLALAPSDDDKATPLAVLLNGATTTKEEMLLWAAPFLEAGVSVLALDWPGTGEAYGIGGMRSDCDDITDGIMTLAEAEDGIDATRVSLVGFSLGGSVAVRAAALDRRVAACITVTSPFDPREWVEAVNPIVRQQLAGIHGDDAAVDAVAGGFAVGDITHRLRCPVLVFGAGRDLVVPPEESLRLTAAVGNYGTLVWYADGAHGLYGYVDDWTTVAARWLAVVLSDADNDDGENSTRVEDATSADSSATTNMT